MLVKQETQIIFIVAYVSKLYNKTHPTVLTIIKVLAVRVSVCLSVREISGGSTCIILSVNVFGSFMHNISCM